MANKNREIGITLVVIDNNSYIPKGMLKNKELTRKIVQKICVKDFFSNLLEKAALSLVYLNIRLGFYRLLDCTINSL